MVSKEELTYSRVPEKAKSHSKISLSTSSLVVVGGKCPLGPFSSLQMHHTKVGHAFRTLHFERSLVHSRKQAAHNLFGTKSGHFGYKGI